MTEFIDKIISKNYAEAEASLKEELASLVEKKLGEKKKMIAGDTPFKDNIGGVKAKRKPLKGVTKVLKDIKEAIVQRDGLVHLAGGEKVLPSVYNQRRGLMEASGGKAHFFDQWEIVKEKLPKGHEGHKHLKMAQDAAENDDMEKAIKHLEHAAKMARDLKEDSADDIGAIVDSLSKRAKAAVPEKADDIDRATKDFKKQAPEAMEKIKGALSDMRKKVEMKEDCGLAPDKEAILHAALDKARMLIQPQLDTTAPPVDRSKVSIPKGMRKGDRLSAPDLGPKEDEWMHGKKLDEAKAAAIGKLKPGEKVILNWNKKPGQKDNKPKSQPQLTPIGIGKLKPGQRVTLNWGKKLDEETHNWSHTISKDDWEKFTDEYPLKAPKHGALPKDHPKHDTHWGVNSSGRASMYLQDYDSTEPYKHKIDEEQLDEVSRKKATDAYAAADDPSYNHPKAGKILKHIERKFGSKAASDAEKHSEAKHFGRGTPKKGTDSLSSGLHPYGDVKLTKAGKIHKSTTKAMKNIIMNRKVNGPKRYLKV